MERVYGSLPLALVAFLGRGLGLLPPLRMRRIPVDRRLEPGFEIGVRGLPAQLGPQLGGVDGIPPVMARTVLDMVEGVLRLAHEAQDQPEHVDVVPLAVRADEVGFADAALGEGRPHGGGMVLRVNPVTHIQPRPVQLRTHTREDVRDLPRDELLHMLVRTVIIAAVADRRPDPIRACPRAHEHVGARLGGRIRARRMVRRLLGELRRIIQRQVTIHLIRADVMITDAVPAHGLEEAEGADDVRAHERLGVGDGVVVMRLRGVMHDGVVAGHDFIEQLRIADVAVDEIHAIRRDALQIIQLARVGQRIQHRHMGLGMVVYDVVDEIRTDEAGTASHDDGVWNEDVAGHISRVLRENTVFDRC